MKKSVLFLCLTSILTTLTVSVANAEQEKSNDTDTKLKQMVTSKTVSNKDKLGKFSTAKNESGKEEEEEKLSIKEKRERCRAARVHLQDVQNYHGPMNNREEVIARAQHSVVMHCD